MKKSLLQGLLGVLVLLVCITFWKPLVWLLISAGAILLTFILAQSGRGREQWVLLPLMILSLGTSPRLWGDLLPTSLIPWGGGVAGMAIILASIKGSPFVSLTRLFVWVAGLSVLLIWGEFPQIWSAYFWLVKAITIGSFCLLWFALGAEIGFKNKHQASIVGSAGYGILLFFCQTLVVWTIGSFLWVLALGGIALLGFISGLLWESRAEILKKIQALHEEVIEAWKDFFSIARDEQ